MRLEMISLSDIDVGERFRKEMGDLQDLIEDIQRHGLINPITLKDCGDGRFLLIAGERRYRALSSLNYEEVPARIYDRDLSDLELRSIELSENLKRKDMTYTEEVMLKKQIHELQLIIHGGEKVARAADAPGWSKSDTARLLECSPSSVHQDLQLAQAMEQFPELGLGDCKNKHEAFKQMKKLGDKLVIHELAKRATAANNAGGLEAKQQRMINSFIIRDFFDAAKELPNNTFDFIEIDPPYSIDLTRIKKENTCDGYNEVPRDKYVQFLTKTFKESYRLMADKGWLICWFAPEPWFEVVFELLRKTGFEVHRMCGIWTKPGGQSNNPTYNLANSYEMFFYARKGAPPLVKQGRSNIFSYSPVPPTSKMHPTERPLELMDELLNTFALPGAKVLVPFAGSGAMLLSAFRQNMTPIGYDLTKAYKDSYTVRVVTG